MNEQLPLFQWREPSWVERVWSRLDPKRRGEILLLLAEMGRAALNQRRIAGKAKERAHEP